LPETVVGFGSKRADGTKQLAALGDDGDAASETLSLSTLAPARAGRGGRAGLCGAPEPPWPRAATDRESSPSAPASGSAASLPQPGGNRRLAAADAATARRLGGGERGRGVVGASANGLLFRTSPPVSSRAVAEPARAPTPSDPAPSSRLATPPAPRHVSTTLMPA